ncbi:YerC/YecD family TrpR-related protein [Frateuria aurantia]
MKRRSLNPGVSSDAAENSLCHALVSLQSVDQMRAFLHDLCTPAELEVMIDRWRVVPYLLDKLSYREIHERTAVSITTIGRVARYLNQGSGGYLAAAAAAAGRPQATEEKA